MSDPFRITDLPHEIQVMIFKEYFGSPFDIQIVYQHGRFIDYRLEFCLLWTSRDVHANARQAYLEGFSGRLDLADVECHNSLNFCHSLMCRTICDTVPRDRVRVINMGQMEPCYCCGIDLWTLDNVCRLDRGIDRRFPNLRKIEVAAMANSLPRTDSAADFHSHLQDGTWDQHWGRILQRKLRNSGPNFGMALLQSNGGNEVPVEVSMYTLVCLMCTDRLIFTQGIGYHFYVCRTSPLNSNSWLTNITGGEIRSRRRSKLQGPLSNDHST